MIKYLLSIGSVIIALGGVFVSSSLTAQEPQEVVEVTVQKLNLRSGAGTTYPVIQTLTKGEKLLVINEKKGWLEVKLPEDTKCWVIRKYVEVTDKEKNIAVVKVGRINIRSRPESGENVIGHISEGQTITIRAEKGEWYQIAPPENITGWISKKYTRYWGNYDRYREVKEKEVQEKANKEVLQEMFEKAEKLYEEEQKKYPIEQDYSAVLRLYKEIVDKSTATSLTEKCKERINQIEPKETILKEFRISLEKAMTDKKSIEKKYQERLAELYRKPIEPPAYDARGWVEGEGKYVGRPSAYKLTLGSKTISFLKSHSINLDKYYGCFVGVRGNIVPNKLGQEKTIIVEKIEMLNEGDF
jgi:uncharacterized protein YgiM (DUF1202 family)